MSTQRTGRPLMVTSSSNTQSGVLFEPCTARVIQNASESNTNRKTGPPTQPRTTWSLSAASVRYATPWASKKAYSDSSQAVERWRSALSSSAYEVWSTSFARASSS